LSRDVTAAVFARGPRRLAMRFAFGWIAVVLGVPAFWASFLASPAAAQTGTVASWDMADRTGQPPSSDGYIAISCGYSHPVALPPDHTVVQWGTAGPAPAAVAGEHFRTLSAGAYHTVGLRDDGTIAQWGGATEGMPGPTEHFTKIAAGGTHTLAL